MADLERGKVGVEVEFKAPGLSKLRALWGEFAGELIEPVAILAAGGSKVQAAWSGMKGIFLSKVLGPLGMVAGAAAGFLLTTKKLVGEWRSVGMSSSKAIERLTLQFKPLLGSIELAKRRAREVFAFSVKSPFQFEELAEGNKMLQALTRGALAGKEGMELVGDAAAVAGSGFQETARYVGRLYDGLMAGRPVGEATMRLQEMGLISGVVRNQIESMQAANASGAEVWRVVEKELQRAKGAMEDVGEGLEGLESTAEDTQRQLEAGFSNGFLEGEKAGIKSATQLMERMTPVAQEFGETFGMVANWFAKLKARVVDVVTGFPGFTTVVTAAATGLLVLAGGIVTATGALVGKFVVGLLTAALGNQALAASSAEVTAAQAAQMAATTALAGAKARLTAASAAVAAGEYAEAAAHARAAVAAGAAAVQSNAAAAGTVLLGGALRGTGAVIGFVVRQFVGMTVAILAMPIFWIATAVIAAGAAMLYLAKRAEKAREEMRAFEKSGRDMIANLEQQRRAIRSVNDLRAAEAAALREVTRARLELDQATQKGDKGREAEARKQLKNAEKELEKIRATPKSALDKGQAEIDREDALRDAEKRAQEIRDEAAGERGPKSERDVATAELAKRQAAFDKAQREMAAEARARDAQEAIQRGMADDSVQEAALKAKRASLQDFAGRDIEKNKPEIRAIEAELDKLTKKREAAAREASNIGLGSGSDLMKLQEQVKLFDEMQASAEAAAKASQAIYEVKGGDGHEERLAQAGLELKNASQAAKEAKRAAEAAGAGDGFNRQDATRAIARLETERTQALDPSRIEEAKQKAAEAEAGLAQARVDSEAQVASLRLKGYERERELLMIEAKKLEMQRERGRIDEESYQRQKAVLAEQAAALEKAAVEKAGELRSAYEIARLSRLEGEARQNGELAKANQLRERMDALEDERVRLEAEKQAAEVTGDKDKQGAYAAAQVAESKAARDAARKREEDGQKLERERTKAEAGTARAALEAELLKLQGRPLDAKNRKVKARQAEDEVTRKEEKQRLLGEGFGADEAERMANEKVKMGQAARLIEQLSGHGATIVADSLAQVGGGGRSYGVDPNSRALERIAHLLEEVADNTKANVDERW